MRRYKSFLFDFDGTLADSRTNIVNSLNAALKANRMNPVDSSQIYPLIGKYPLEQHFLKFYSEISSKLMDTLIADFREHQTKFLDEELTIFPHVRDVLSSLKESGIQIALLTTKGTEQAKKMLKLLNMDSYFSIIYGRDLPYGEKPQASCVEYIRTHLPIDTAKSECVMVGDTQIDIQTAKNAQIDSVGVTYGIGTKEELISAGATYLIDDFAELLEFIPR